MIETKIYTAPEVAKILRIGVKLVYEEIARGKLKAKKIGRVIRIPESYLEEYINNAK